MTAFGTLKDLSLREAWRHEAKDFTPWLASNIDRLSQAISIPLELTGTEVAVEDFSADILAQNAEDGSYVLIENQLERTDHKHLGQILTYLAGLEAQTVIWIAPDFREPHLTAIRWLNDHTSDGFSFFAVALRVVQIDNSAMAPLFEIVAKPDNFERQLKRQVNLQNFDYYDTKKAFWEQFLRTYPQWEPKGVRAYRLSNNYVRVLDDPNIDLVIWVGRNKSGIYVRSASGEPTGPVGDFFEARKSDFDRMLSGQIGPSSRGHFYSHEFPKGHEDKESWSETIAWLDTSLRTYVEAF